MVQSCSALGVPTEGGSAQPPYAGGRPVAGRSQHGERLPHSQQSATDGSPEAVTPVQELEGSGTPGQVVARRTSEATVSDGHLDLLGGPPATPDSPLHPAVETTDRGRWLLRPVDLVRALNGCGRGEVISERQLRRHRNRAGTAICHGRKVDLLAYAAWLTEDWCRDHPEPCLSGPVNTRNIVKLIMHQNQRCSLTGRRLIPDDMALDHIIPVCRGGEHEMENVQVLHKQVNRAKGTLTNEEFIALCREVVAHADGANSNHKEAQ